MSFSTLVSAATCSVRSNVRFCWLTVKPTAASATAAAPTSQGPAGRIAKRRLRSLARVSGAVSDGGAGGRAGLEVRVGAGTAAGPVVGWVWFCWTAFCLPGTVICRGAGVRTGVVRCAGARLCARCFATVGLSLPDGRRRVGRDRGNSAGRRTTWRDEATSCQWPSCGPRWWPTESPHPSLKFSWS